MWEQKEFAKHWKNEFPDGEVPQMNLKSVEDIESELESCKANLKTLQKALAEEKFKMIYLQTTMARQKRGDPERFDGKDENFNAAKYSFQKFRNLPKPHTRDNETDRAKVTESVGVKVQVGGLPAGLGSSFSREKGRFGGKTGKPVPIPVPPRIFQRGQTAPAQTNDNEDTSDREYEDTELNENFVRNNLLAPKNIYRDNQKTSSKQRDVRRHLSLSRDLDSGDDGRLSPSFPHIQRTASRGSGCSTPDRRSDGYLSSDHDDSSSVDFNYNTDGYEGDGTEDGKSQDGSETLPYIDESPTMSPQLCVPQGPNGEAVSPTPEGLSGVREHRT